MSHSVVKVAPWVRVPAPCRLRISCAFLQWLREAEEESEEEEAEVE